MRVKWVLIGEVATSHGIRGEIKVIPHTDFPERFEGMTEVLFFGPADQEPRFGRRVENVRFHKGAVILKLGGVDSIEEAQALRGMQIKVAADDVVPLPEGSYYMFQLLGLECITTSGMCLGHITDVLSTGANDVYVVKPLPGVTSQDEILIPVLPHVVRQVDLERGQVLIELMDGLLE